jgi:hypothetical protein
MDIALHRSSPSTNAQYGPPHGLCNGTSLTLSELPVIVYIFTRHSGNRKEKGKGEEEGGLPESRMRPL